MGDPGASQLSGLRTALCDLLGIRYPICQAGMGWVARSGLAAAVSEAGGLGVIARLIEEAEATLARLPRQP